LAAWQRSTPSAIWTDNPDGTVSPLSRLPPRSYVFPDPETALETPNGLLAVGGDLSPPRLIEAYRHGVFPWFDDDDGPILWWSPDPRAVLRPNAVRIRRSLRRRLKQKPFRVTADRAFARVVRECAAPRPDGTGRESSTWITPRMQAAYIALHEAGFAHSIECWEGESLVGGLYGVSLGRLFFGESMFSRRNDASKIALVHLARQLDRWGFPLIDSQVMNPHMQSLGAEDMPRRAFLDVLRHNVDAPTRLGPWTLDATEDA
jgi:leucyl/phenylalanyl-tRNA--protein transferase